MAGPRPASFDYHTYLASREWSLLREKVRERSGNRCEHCFREPQQAVHHLTYERIGQEDLRDLMAVCNPCHEFLSGKSHENPLGMVAVVTPELMTPFWQRIGWTRGNHYIIPMEPGAVEVTTCRGVGCIWCTYQDDNWPIFLRGLVLS